MNTLLEDIKRIREEHESILKDVHEYEHAIDVLSAAYDDYTVKINNYLDKFNIDRKKFIKITSKVYKNAMLFNIHKYFT